MAYPVEWPGFSDKKYKHYVYEWGHSFKKGPGNYIFCSIDADDTWYPIYIGETSDFASFLGNHHKMRCVLGIGATHIHAHTNNGGDQSRLIEKEDLIHVSHPICQHF